MEITHFNPDVRALGAVRRREIRLTNGYVLAFSDVFDFDTAPFIGLDVYYPQHVPVGYMCVIDGDYLQRLEWNQVTDEVEVVGNTGNKKVVAIKNGNVVFQE